jgi:hypothetical protein
MNITRIACFALLAASVGVTACGSSPVPGSARDAQGVRAAYEKFTHLYLNGKADKACDTYTTARARVLIKTLGASCPELLSEVPRNEAPSDALIRSMRVTITGDKASYNLPDNDGTAIYANGHWRFDTDLSGASKTDAIQGDATEPDNSATAEATPGQSEDSAPTEDDTAAGDGESGPKQTFHNLNEWGQDDSMRVKVTSIEKVQSIPPADEFSDAVVDKPSSSLIAVKLTIQNAGQTAIDPLCGGAGGFVLLDANDRNFNPLDKSLDINSNVCDDGIQPGFKSSYTLAFRLPSGSQVGGLVVWNDDAEDDFDGQKTELVFTR